MLEKLARKGLSFSLIVGTLLVPLTALAALWLTDPDRQADESSAPTTTSAVVTVDTQLPDAPTIELAAELETACGPEGMQLVSLEEAVTITELQQAALDALREVCEQQGIPLPPKPAADPMVQTIIVPASAANPSPGTTPTTLDDEDHDDDEYDDDHGEHEDDEDDEDDEDEEHEHGDDD